MGDRINTKASKYRLDIAIPLFPNRKQAVREAGVGALLD